MSKPDDGPTLARAFASEVESHAPLLANFLRDVAKGTGPVSGWQDFLRSVAAGARLSKGLRARLVAFAKGSEP